MTARSGRWLAMNVSGSKVHLKGVPTREPVFNLEATWIDAAERKTAELNGFSLLDSGGVPWEPYCCPVVLVMV